MKQRFARLALAVMASAFLMMPATGYSQKNPCAGKNPCAVKNPCGANPCAVQKGKTAKTKKATKNPCGANPCAANPCAGKNPCAVKK